MNGFRNLLLWRLLAASLLGLVLAGCEAPLNLAHVNQEKMRERHQFDQFKGVVANDSRVVAVADAGVVLTASIPVAEWQRVELPTRASFVNVAACPSGRFVAIDTRHHLWVSDTQAAQWTPRPIDSEESLMGLACAPDNRVWIGGSYSTLLSSDDFGETWSSTTQEQDLLFTAIQFIDSDTAVVAGEFGTLMVSEDGGHDWQATDPMPNEFYPMGLYFSDAQTGWVSGLSGTILHTADGGQSWEREATSSAAPLYSFAAMGKRLFAFGDNGTLLERRGSTWDKVAGLSEISSYLVGGVALSNDQLLLAGGRGTLTTVELIGDGATVAAGGVTQ